MITARVEDALAKLDRNLVVLAGAGTGKTSLLVERLLYAVGSGHLELPQAAAITFTEKAAAEMRHRLALGLERLRARAAGEAGHDPRREADRAVARLFGAGVPAAEVAGRARRALGEVGAASIETIHGFCARLLRTWPREAGVDPRFEVDPGPGEAVVVEEAWERFLARELGPGALRAERWRAVLTRVPIDAVASAARGLASWVIPDELLDPGVPGPDARALFGSEAALLADRLEDLLARSSGKCGLHARTREKLLLFARLLRAFAEEGRDAVDDPALPKALGAPTPSPSTVSGSSPEEVAGLFEEARGLLRTLVRIDAQAVRLLRELAAPFAREVREILLARGVIGFDALLALAARLLREHPRVREALKRQVRMLLVDEFQDTDPLQYEIVLWLAEEAGTTALDPYAARLGPGRLFVVGDPKQSIYRFRGADHAAFRRAVARILEEDGTEVPLVDNWRSVPEVLDPVHALFASGAGVWVASEHQPAYVPVVGRGEAERVEPPCVEVWTIRPPEKARAPERRLAESRVLAREIRALVDGGGATYRQVSVLLRAFTALRPLLRALREHGVPFVVQGGREFLERPEVEHLLAALRVAVRPDDPVALLAWLRSPAAGVTDRELAAWARGAGGWSAFDRPDATAFPGLARALALLRAFLDEARDLPPDGVVRAALARTALPVLEASAHEGAQRLANLRKLAARAADLGRDGRLSLAEVVDELDGRAGERAEAESPLADEATDAVRILTVHAAKGLENRIVFVADLAHGEGRPGGGDPVRVAHLPGGPALAVGVDGAFDAARAWLEREDARHERAEGLRVLYVALTRARERLVLTVAHPDRGRAPWVEALAPWGYDPDSPPDDGSFLSGGRVRHRLLRPDPPGLRPAEVAPRRRLLAVAAYERAREILEAAATPPVRRPSALHAERADREPGDGGPRSVARAAGTAVHAVLERWDGDPRRLGDLVPSAAGRAARGLGADGVAVLTETRTILEAFAASPLASRFRDILPLARREVPLLLSEDGAIWTGTLDLLYPDSRQGWTVVDHKTDREGSDHDLAARYRDQLKIYARAVRLALALPSDPRAVLWLLRSGREIPV